MTIEDQNGSGVRTEQDVNKIHFPSWTEKITIPAKTKTGIKEPVKLVFQMIFYFIIFIPFTIWAIVSYFFTRRKSVRNNVIMITGSGRGLGRGLALKFAELDCKIACVDIDEINNAETVRLIKEKYPSAAAIPYRCNIASEDDIKYLSKNITNDLGDVDIIVNNAGIVSGVRLIESNSRLEKKYLNAMMDVNLKSHVMIIAEFLPKMRQRNSGHIVAISSLAGLNGLPNASVYSATKHGIVGLMESLYDELRTIPNNKIQTTCVCPYFIATNELYAKHWDTRIPPLTTKQATNATVDAILKNRRMVAVPSSLYIFSILLRLLPDNLRNLQKNIFYAHLNLPDDDTLSDHIGQIIEDSTIQKQTPPQNENEKKITTSQ